MPVQVFQTALCQGTVPALVLPAPSGATTATGVVTLADADRTDAALSMWLEVQIYRPNGLTLGWWLAEGTGQWWHGGPTADLPTITRSIPKSENVRLCFSPSRPVSAGATLDVR